MTYDAIRYEVSDGVATITLDRPEARNAFTGTMGRELSDAYRRSDADDDVGAVVVTGTPPAFCSGADLRAGGTPSDPVPKKGSAPPPPSCGRGTSGNWSSRPSTGTPSVWV